MDGIGAMVPLTTTLFHDMASPFNHHFQTNHQRLACLVPDDTWSLDRSIGLVGGDDFFVDELLDLGGIQEESLEQPMCNEDPGEAKQDADSKSSNSNSSALSFDNIEPIVPAGDISDLEWVSKIVDDSFDHIPYSAAITPSFRPTTPILPITTTNNHSRSLSFGSVASITSASTSMKRGIACFSDHALFVPAKARSKRARTGGHAWSFRHPLLTEPLCSSPVSSSSSCSSNSSFSSLLLLDDKTPIPYTESHTAVVPRGRGRPPLHKKNTHEDHEQKKPKKKKGRKPKAPVTELSPELNPDGGNPNARRCSHCGVQKTPQWRAGPMGAKTLCNACGVRYKSGRLLPEYRPAISPTFLDHVHSNSHRKVLEMRRKKDLHQQQQVLVVAAADSLPALPAQHMVF